MACIFHNKPCVFFDVRKGIQKTPISWFVFHYFCSQFREICSRFPGRPCTPGTRYFQTVYHIFTIIYIFVIGLGLPFSTTYRYKKKRYAHQVFGNVGNFQIAYSDGIVVLAYSVDCFYHIMYARFPTTSELRRGIVSSTLYLLM